MKKLCNILFLFCLPGLLPAALNGTLTQSSNSVGRYDVFELTFAHSGAFSNPWCDPVITAYFVSPASQRDTISGFYDDSAKWRVRYAPSEVGAYNYDFTFSNGSDFYTSSGTFTVTVSNNRGFVRKAPANPYNMITEGDGKFFFWLGVPQQHWDDFGTTPPLAGVDRSTPDGRPDFGYSLSETPWVSPWYDGTSGLSTYYFADVDTVFRVFAASGCNAFRSNAEPGGQKELQDFNPGGTGKFIINPARSRLIDAVLKAGHNHGIHFLWCPYYRPADFFTYNYDMSDVNKRNAWFAYHKYVIARYGAYVDMWELANEETLTDAYIATMAQFIKANDPYHHPVGGGGSLNNAQYNAADLDINTPHPYWDVSSMNLEGEYVNGTYGIKNHKAAAPNRPFIHGETGDRCPNADAQDSTRIRTYLWAGLMNQLTGWMCWDNSDYKPCTNPGYGYNFNFYFGPREREYAKIFSDYIADWDAEAVPTNVAVSANVSGYAMASTSDLGAYFLHTNSRTTSISGATVTLTVPTSGLTGKWIDPATGNVLQTFMPSTGSQTLTIPAFTNDIALRIRVAGSTESDVFIGAEKGAGIAAYPNPFRASVTLRVNPVSDGSLGRIGVYDVSGRCVADLSGTVRQGKVEWKTGALPNGMYVVKATLAGKSVTRKIMLMK